MNRTITPEETREIFEFCHRHYVYHYDLQVELVDHIASSIESLWAENPEIPFREALMNSFKKFGISGFSKIKEQKQKELSRKYNRLFWKYFLEFYRWPKVVLTLALTMVLFLILTVFKRMEWIVAVYFMLYFIFGVWYFRWGHKKYEIIPVKKKFMIVDFLKNLQLGSVSLISIPCMSISWFETLNHHQFTNKVFYLPLALVMVSLAIILYAQYIFIPQKIRDHFFEQFPQFDS